MEGTHHKKIYKGGLLMTILILLGLLIGAFLGKKVVDKKWEKWDRDLSKRIKEYEEER